METFEQRAQRRRATWTGFLARSPDQLAAFERNAIRAMAPEERVAAIWGLVLAMPGRNDAAEYRLDRSLARLERRKR